MCLRLTVMGVQNGQQLMSGDMMDNTGGGDGKVDVGYQ